MDLDEFLSENGIPVEGQVSNGAVPAGVSPHKPENGRISPCGSSQPGMLPKRERSPSPSEPMSPLTINPPSPADSSEYLTTVHCSTVQDSYEADDCGLISAIVMSRVLFVGFFLNEIPLFPTLWF